MINFKSITLQNFLSYGNAPITLVLDRPGTTLIAGEDLDNTSSGPVGNGCGKTAIINALTYALYGKPLSNISKDNLINNINKKNLIVSVDFTKDDKTYRVIRARKTKAGAAGNYVHLYENGIDKTPDSVSNTNAKIVRIIGIPYEVFVRVVAFSATHVPFLDLPVRSHYAANQTDIIEELFDLKTLSEKASVLKDKIKDTERSVETHKLRIDQLEKEHDRHQRQIEAAERRILNWQSANKHKIAEIKDKLTKIMGVDIEEQRQLMDMLNNVDSKLQQAIHEFQQDEKALKRYKKQQKKLQDEVVHLAEDKCPYCLQQYNDAESKISETQTTLDDVTQKITDLEKRSEELASDMEEHSSAHKEITEKITIHDIDELIEIQSKKDRYEKNIIEMEETENPHIETLNELKVVKLDPIDSTKLNELNRLWEHQKFLFKLLTKKDSFVRKTLLNKNIPFLNQRLTHYLSELGLPHTVEFTHEMTASISQFGRPLDFGNLSNGQQARVNIALSFAFMDVLQNMHDKINICMLDEVLDIGLDAVGVQSAARMLKRKARDEKLSMYIISHKDEVDGVFDNKMIVQISKGFSQIKFEE